MLNELKSTIFFFSENETKFFSFPSVRKEMRLQNMQENNHHIHVILAVQLFAFPTRGSFKREIGLNG